MIKTTEVAIPQDGYLGRIVDHYIECWDASPQAYRLEAGPTNELSPNFCVLEFAPTSKRSMWTYATCGMSNQGDATPIECHLFSDSKHLEHVELLTVVAHYHLTGAYLDLGHSVNFGRPWMPGSKCDHGLISLPYLDGPRLEWADIENRKVRFLWLVPITAAERAYKKQHGLEKLESLFEEKAFNYLDAKRESVVP